MPQRPHCLDYVTGLITDFVPFSGDRKFGDDDAIVGGFGRFGGESICVIGHEKGSTTEARLKHNFGMARPEGYRKAVRLMEMADRFDIPVLCAGRYRRRLSRDRRRGARTGGSDRALDRGLSQSRRAQCGGHSRRRRIGRRHCDRDRQPRADARARDLQRDLTGRRGIDPVARHHQGAGSRDQHEDHGAGPGPLRRSSTRSSASRSAARIATRRPRSSRPAKPSHRRLARSEGPRPRNAVRKMRRDKFLAIGRESSEAAGIRYRRGPKP